MLGRGGGGVVLRGRCGATDVAVKLMEMPVEADPAAATAPVPAASLLATAAAATAPGGEQPAAREAAPGEEAARLRARRTMLRNAMELWCGRALNHPNVVQVYATYTSVV